MNRPWTEPEIAILLNAKNKKRIKIPNRSEKSIRRKLISMGLAKPLFKVRPHRKKAWSQYEISLLKSSKNPRQAKIGDRTKESIVRMANKLGLIEKKQPKRPWKKSDEKILTKLAKEGKTPIEIYGMNVFSKTYSKNSIQKKLGYLGLSKKSPEFKKFPKHILIQFKDFIKENWQGKTPDELEYLWNENNEFKVNKNKVIYHLTAMKLKIPYVEVARIKNLKKKEEKIKKKNMPIKQLEESLRLARMELMCKRMLKSRDIWTGLPLNEEELAEFNQESY